jgi:hypothetical protein
MKLLVLQIENRKDDFLFSLIQRNKDVATKYGFDHVFLSHGDETIPHYWQKVFALDQLMHERKDIDLFMWLDSDAFIIQWSKKNVFHLVSNDSQNVMWISPDAPKYYASFCAGAFLVRNNSQGRDIIGRWKSLYQPKMWTKHDNGSWISNGEFAGPYYEQGAFIEHILPHANELGIKVLPYYVFNEINCDSPNPASITVHLAGNYKDQEKKDECTHTIKTVEPFAEQQIMMTFGVWCALVILVLMIVCLNTLRTRYSS